MTQEPDDDPQKLLEETRQQMEQMQQQVLSYGRDLAAIYLQEKEKRQALEFANQKLAAALDGMSDGFLVVDAQLRVEQINRAGLQLLETSATAATGQQLPQLMSGQGVDALVAQLQQEKASTVRERVTLQQPVQRVLHVEAARLPDAGWGLVLHDVTWEERLSNMRNEFLNIAAHELRTPLAGVIGFTSLLSQLADERQLDSDTRRMLNNILGSSERMRKAVDELLSFASSEHTQFNPELLPLESVLEAAVSSQRELAEKRKAALFLTLPQESMPVYADRHMLRVAFVNLIENGILFNRPGGSVHIQAEVRDRKYVVRVIDTGIGISQVDLKHVYDPLFQVEEHTTRRTEGLGLGLSIARKTILLHEGEIAIDSALNEGTTIEISLPQYEEAPEPSETRWLSQQLERSNQELAIFREAQARAESVIHQLEEQLQHAQAQSMAYAQDLANLYRRERSEAQRLKEHTARLSHSDRLAMMGQIAASVAHDLSNLVTPILGYSQIILRRKESIDPDLVDIAERILAASRRANILLRQMVTLAGSRSAQREWVNLNALIEETVRFLEVRFRHAAVKVVDRYSADALLINCNQVQISQVLLNLIVNAIDAMGEGGVLTLETGRVRDEGSEWARLRITDTGSGIAPENLSKIFEPFFTTKPESVGTGLGLSVSKDIIEEHGGRILVQSEVGVGTTFTVDLPPADLAGGDGA